MTAWDRSFLFLQGPPGPFFRMLGDRLAGQGVRVRRINLNGGDRRDWPGADAFRGRAIDWPGHLDRYLRDHAVTDLVLYGDCRPMHHAARGIARLRGLTVHVFEEGYIRPDWMTLELDGVNGHSRFPRDPGQLRAAAATLPPIVRHAPITASFRRRARDSYWYYHRVVADRWLFPFYRSHRPGSIIAEGLGWAAKFLRARRRAGQADRTLAGLAGRSFFLLPLQLGSDFQIRVHSPFPDMHAAADYVLESFVRHAPADALLVVKEHPLDAGWRDWRRWLIRRARALGAADRIVHLDGGDLQSLSAAARGVVCVNSTSATLALAAGTPVKVLGTAIYDIPGLTDGQTLDAFWSDPHAPSDGLYDAFCRVLHDRCLVYGGLASQSALATLVDTSTVRILGSGAPAAVDHPWISDRIQRSTRVQCESQVGAA